MLGSRSAVAWGSGNRWTIVYRAPDSSISGVEVMGGVQLPMARLGQTNLWVLSLHLPDAERAVISLSLLLQQGERFRREDAGLREWRGAQAPAPPLQAEELQGSFWVDSLWSNALGAWRRISVYLPPHLDRNGTPLPVVYFADGQGMEAYARVVDPLIAGGRLGPTALIGIWASTGSPSGGNSTGPADDLRAIEYHEGVENLPGADSLFVVNRYRAHKRFFLEEVRRWAEDALGVSAERKSRAVHGVSSGGHFALLLGRERPDIYGLVIASSNGSASALAQPSGGWEHAARHYLSVGTLEQPSIRRVLVALGDSLTVHGVPNTVDVYPGGHDSKVWVESFPRALSWWQTSQSRHIAR
ncbi:MAG: alpha/beta hydrolase [Longimicrobiales bacterium]